MATQTEYKRLSAGDYGTSKVPGLEIIKYTGVKPNADGSVRHSFLVKALMPSREQSELILKASSNGKSNPYMEEPDTEGTVFLSFNLRNEWLNPACVAVAMGRENVYLAEKKVDQAQLDAANKYLVEEATAAASALGSADEKAQDEALEKIKQQIQINVGTIFRLQTWAGKPEDEQADFSTLVGTKFSGKIVERPGNNGKVFQDVKVKSKGK